MKLLAKPLWHLKKLLSQVNGNGVDSLNIQTKVEIERLRLAIRELGECGQTPMVERRVVEAESVDGLCFVCERESQSTLSHPLEVIDLEIIRQICQYCDEKHGDTLVELIGLFLELTPKRIEHLKQALAKKDWHVVSKDAHSLKSSSANIGAKKLSSVCRKLETIENHPDHSMASQLISEIETQYRLASQSLTELLKKRVSAQKASA
jgi:HPt (histidine-containing phosphotransfer) domain-containing protein